MNNWRNFETYFEITFLNGEKIQSYDISHNEFVCKIKNVKDDENFDLIFKLETIDNIRLHVYGPMNSFGSNCGEVVETIWVNKNK